MSLIELYVVYSREFRNFQDAAGSEHVMSLKNRLNELEYTVFHVLLACLSADQGLMLRTVMLIIAAKLCTNQI